MNLLYITFGNNVSVHLQAAFSICSFLAQPTQLSSVNIVTDRPDLYQHFSTKVNIIPTNEHELKEWQGPHGFFWRIKIKALEKASGLFPNSPIVYLDTDTFLFGDSSSMASALANGKAFMHEREGTLSGQKSKTINKMWLQIKDQTYSGISMKTMDAMWNAGVVAFPNTKGGGDMRLALSICDHMCAAGVTRRLIEQYALTVALAHTYGLQEAKPIVAHYWSVKDVWDKAISDFFIQAHFSAWPLEKVIGQMRTFDLTKIPIYQRTRDTNKRLKTWVDKMYPPQNVTHLP